MLDAFLFILVAVVGLVVVTVAALGALAFLGSITAGRLIEALADLVLPAPKTGLGAGGIVDEPGRVTRAIEAAAPDDAAPLGMVQVAGELWKACAPGGPLAAGAQVRVVGVEGMVAIVEAASASADEA